MRAAFAIGLLLAALSAPAAHAGVAWGDGRFDKQQELCAWLRTHGSRCDVWAIRHPHAWQGLAPGTRVNHAPTPAADREAGVVRPVNATEASLAVLAGVALLLSVAPLPAALGRTVGGRVLEIRIALCTFACAVAGALALALF